MCRTQCVLALVALYVGLAQSRSWDIALLHYDTLQFFVNDTMTHSEAVPKHSRTYYSLTYDAVNNKLLIPIENSHNSYDIASVNLETMEIQTLVKCEHNILDIAFDPVTELIFWTNYLYGTSNIIYWYSLIPGSQNIPTGNILFNMGSAIFVRIDVDSCRGYIYCSHYEKSKRRYVIERARFNGSEREVLIELNDKYYISDLVIDQQTQKMYWIETEIDLDSAGFSIISADLTGKNRTLFYYFKTSGSLGLTVSKNYIYIDNGTNFGKLSKNSIPAVYTRVNLSKKESDLAVNYKIEEQIQGIQDCAALKSLLPVTNDDDSLNVTADVNLVCVHGTKVSGKSLGECTRGYTGERCDVSVCQNYCLEGNCTVSAEGQPKCSCNAGYSGTRCEDNACHRYCLNGGFCSLNENSEPVCQCKEDYEGARCNVSVCHNHCFRGDCSVRAEGQPECSCNAGYTGERCELTACHGYCLNEGICSLNENHEPVCQCIGDHKGARCNVSVCYNYCFRGDCSVRAEGQPECSCNAGYSGTRCEVNACQGYCYNCGVCSLNENSEPVCQCKEDYEGERCDVSVRQYECIQTVSLLRDILSTDVSPDSLDKGGNPTCASTIV